MNTTLTRTVAVLTLAGASLAACGGSSKSNGGATTKPTGPALTGTPYNVMTITIDGTSGANFPDVGTVAMAYEKFINTHGGVAGHPLNVTVCNDMNDPNQSATCARKAVADHDIAVVGSFSFGGGAILPILAKAGISEIGQAAASALDFSVPNSFPIQAGPAGFTAVGAALADDPSCTSIDAVQPDEAALDQLTPFYNLGLGTKKINKFIKVPATATDFSSTAAATRGANCVVNLMGSQQFTQFLAAMKTQGLNPKYVQVTGSVTPTMLTQFSSQLEGAVLLSQFAAPSNPGWADYNAAIAAYGKKIDMTNAESQDTWVSYDVLNAVAKSVSGPVTGKSITAALSKSKAVDTGGLTPPINFSKQLPITALRRLFDTSFTKYVIKNGEITQPAGFVDYKSKLVVH